MQRITITIDDDLLDTIDRLSEQRGYSSRSEALRDIVRETVTREQVVGVGDARCFATLSYIYEHETRELAKRLTSAQHHHHDLSVSTLHVHIDGEDCLEVAVLKGRLREVREFANGVIAQRGVRLGHLHIMPMNHHAHKHHHSHGRSRK